MAITATRTLLAAVLVLISTGASAQGFIETLRVVWPAEYKWKIDSQSDHDGVLVTKLIPEGETDTTWTSQGTLITLQGVTGVSLEQEMLGVESRAKQVSADSKRTVIAKDTASPTRWILFKVEMPKTANDPRPESKLVYLIQGAQSYFALIVAVKEASLSDAFLARWIPIVKSSTLLYR